MSESHPTDLLPQEECKRCRDEIRQLALIGVSMHSGKPAPSIEMTFFSLAGTVLELVFSRHRSQSFQQTNLRMRQKLENPPASRPIWLSQDVHGNSLSKPLDSKMTEHVPVDDSYMCDHCSLQAHRLIANMILDGQSDSYKGSADPNRWNDHETLEGKCFPSSSIIILGR